MTIPNACGRVHQILIDLDTKADQALAAAQTPGPKGDKGDAGVKGDKGDAGLNYNIVIVKSNYTALANDVVLADTTNGSFTVTLPAVNSNQNKTIYVKKISSDNNRVTVACSGSDLMDGQRSMDLRHGYDDYRIIAGGGFWNLF